MGFGIDRISEAVYRALNRLESDKARVRNQQLEYLIEGKQKRVNERLNQLIEESEKFNPEQEIANILEKDINSIIFTNREMEFRPCILGDRPIKIISGYEYNEPHTIEKYNMIIKSNKIEFTTCKHCNKVFYKYENLFKYDEFTFHMKMDIERLLD